jgi:hypothetical protein
MPWSTIVPGDRMLKVVFSDPNIGKLQRMFRFQISLADYACGQYVPDRLKLPPDAATFARVLNGDHVAP